LIAVSLYQGWFTGIETKYQTFLHYTSLVLTLPVIGYAAVPFFRAAVSGLRVGILHMDLPISIGIVAGFLVSVWGTVRGADHVYFDSVCSLVFFLLVGRWLQRAGLDKITAGTGIWHAFGPASALRLRGNSADAPADEVFIGTLREDDLVRIPGGARVPADGILLFGEGSINRAVLSGESRPIPVRQGDELHAGAVNLGADLVMRVVAPYRQSRLGRLARQVEDAQAEKSTLVRASDTMSTYFVAVLLTVAIATLIYWIRAEGVTVAVEHTLALLVVACPCALGLAAPIAMSVALGKAAKAGIVVKNGETLEQLARIKRAFVDKTGTLTEGVPRVVRSYWEKDAPAESSSLIIGLEAGSTHPYAGALRRHLAWDERQPLPTIEDRNEIPGCGVVGENGSSRVRIGSPRWLSGEGVHFSAEAQAELAVIRAEALSPIGFALSARLVALFGVGDALRENSDWFVRELRSLDIDTTMLSGDDRAVVEARASQLGIDCQANVAPEAKAQAVAEANPSIMIGDGVNDALAMRQATVGVAVAGGAELSLLASDVYVSEGPLESVVAVLRGARSTLSTIKRNFALSLFYNVSAGGLAAFGYITPLVAAILMPLSSATVIVSSLAFLRGSFQRQHEKLTESRWR
ncbi:MAG: cation-translocating P-type ATPase, partial [Bdellovibrionales bacterium]|nr:cation-translocating P-type ATPase [Bdellovibrionales bacterium]